MAGGGDIRYELKSGRTIRERWLSNYVGPQRAEELAGRIATLKGSSGKRVLHQRCVGDVRAAWRS